MRDEIIGDDNKEVVTRSIKSLKDGDFVVLKRLVDAKSTEKIATSKVRHFIVGLIIITIYIYYILFLNGEFIQRKKGQERE